jgi:small subunit ribosomal protein S1
VDIGGLDGLLHVSDMSYARVEDPQQVVQVGQKLKLIVLKVDREKRRISLGLKQALPDPWAQAESKWRPDDIVTGRIVRLADFGAFLELTPGVEGLIPISEMSYHRRLHHPSQIVSEGDAVKARVLSLDVANKRISLSIKRIEDDPWTGASVRWPVGSVAAGRVSRIAEFGAFVELAPGVEGLVHVSELGVGYVRSVAEVVGEGDAVEAKVLSVDEESRRISLSVKQAAAAPEHTQAAPAPAEEAQPEPSKSPQRRRPLKGGLE